MGIFQHICKAARARLQRILLRRLVRLPVYDMDIVQRPSQETPTHGLKTLRHIGDEKLVLPFALLGIGQSIATQQFSDL